MARRIPTFVVSLLLALPACGAAAQSNPGAEPPTLVVFITVDQMRADYFQRFDHQLTGGLRQLFDQSAFFLEGFQDHAITETAPGHASTMSGRFPVHTGIVMNSQGVNTADAPLIGAREIGASPFRFQGTTLTDWMKAKQPEMRFLSVSRKDRGAILPIGLRKGPVFWYSANGTFTTSTYYADSLPPWVMAFNARKLPHSYAGKPWTTLLPARQYVEPDSVPLESNGVDYVFPHPVPQLPEEAAAAAAMYPWMDDITLQFALSGVNELGLGATAGRTDLLAVSLSTTDAIGHRFGPDSRELHDQILRLDRSLGVFLDSLFKLRGKQRILLALTGDHGMTPYPDLKSKIYPNGDAKRVSLNGIWRVHRSRMMDMGVDSTAMAFEEGVFFVLDPKSFNDAKVNFDSAAAEFATDAMMVQGVLRADLMRDLAKADTTSDTIARRWLHMFGPRSGARMIVTLTPYSYWLTTTFATHGSPHDGDAHVPLLFWGAGVKAGKYPGFVRVVDMAPTLAALLQVTPLEKLDGRVLRQAIK
jgi:predicted AlkP superfamily pyrophosphatase or phosphodiesterase